MLPNNFSVLENAFALMVSSAYLGDLNLFEKSKKILIAQLNEQILEDGGHFEQSPMYHSILLTRLLDVINIIESIECTFIDEKLKEFLRQKAAQMLSWLNNTTFNNGDIPLTNDSSANIALSHIEIRI